MTDVATLDLDVNSSKLKTAERAQESFARSAETTERRVNKATDRINNAFNGLASVAGALAGSLAAAISAGAALRAAENYTRMTNGLRAMGLSADQAADRLDAINEIAGRTRAPLDATAQLYTRISVAAGELGASQQDVLQFTENVGLALGAAGIGANEASGALLQLSQAMAGGTVRAEEFNSILEGAYPLALAAARGIDEAGGSVGKLRQLVIEGKISSEEFFNAILSQSSQLQASFDNTNATIGQAMTRLSDNLTMAIGQMDQALGITSAMASGILFLADNIDRLAAYAAAAGVVLAAAYTPAIIAASLAMGKLVISLVATRAALLATGFGALVVVLGEVIYQVLQLSDRMGGFGNMMQAVGDLAAEIWDRIGQGANFVYQSVVAMSEGMKASFLMAINSMLGAFVDFTWSVADGINGLFGTSLMGMDAGITRTIGNLATASDAARAAAEASAAASANAFSAPLKSIDAFSVAASDAADAADNAGESMQSLGEGAGNAGKGAKKATDDLTELQKQMERPLISAIDGVSNAFGDFVARGFKDFGSFVKSIPQMFLRMLGDMAAMAMRNRIMISLGMGGSVAGSAANAGGSLLGGGGMLGSFLGSFGSAGGGLAGMAGLGGTGLLGGVGNVVGGFASGGFGGAFAGLGSSLAGATTGLAGLGAAIGAIATVALPVALILGAFRKKVTELDSGLRVTVSNLETSVDTFRTIETRRFFGLSKRVSTSFATASDDVASPVDEAVASVQKSIMDAAKSFGFGADAFNGFSYQFQLSLKGLSQQDAMAKVTEEIGKLGDAFAGMLPNFKSMNELMEAYNQRISLEDRLLQLQGKTAELLARQRERERNATHELNRSLLDQIYALEDQAAATDAATRAADEFARAMMSSNLFVTAQDRQYAATAFGSTRPAQQQLSAEERELMVELIRSVREGNINNARLLTDIKRIDERNSMEAAV